MLNKPILWLTQSQSALPRLIIRKFSERKSMLEAAELVISLEFDTCDLKHARRSCTVSKTHAFSSCPAVCEYSKHHSVILLQRCR